MTTATGTITLEIPRHPPQSLNTVLAMHWRDMRKHSTLWRYEAFLAWNNAGQPRFAGQCRITITLYARGDRQIRDAENLAASCKPILDGLKGHCFPDDSIAIIGTPEFVQRVDNKRPRVVIEIRPVEAA